MSTQMTEPRNGHDRELSGVRTYRGRKLEDLIPQIRAELGPDAIILRQREGLMGGVGGFFAQKCVEVDAQAAPHTPQIDIYDEDEPVNGWDEGLEDFLASTPDLAASATPALPAPAPAQPEPIAPQPEPIAPQPEPFAAQPEPIAAQPEPIVEQPEANIFAAPPAQETPPAVPAELTAESFVSRLEQAAAHVDIDELVKLVTSGRVLAGDAPAAPAPAPEAPVAPEPVVEAPAPARRRDARPGPGRRDARPGPGPRARRRDPRPRSRRSRAARREPLGRQAVRWPGQRRGRGRLRRAHRPGHQRELGPAADRGGSRPPLAALQGQPA